MQVDFNRDLKVKNVAGSGIRTNDLPTWINRLRVSVILSPFSYFSVHHRPRIVSHYYLGDPVVTSDELELPLGLPRFCTSSPNCGVLQVLLASASRLCLISFEEAQICLISIYKLLLQSLGLQFTTETTLL